MGARWNDGRRFEGRVAVVTGGGGTLGGAVARGFVSEAASVALGYRSSRAKAAEVVAELEGLGGQAHSGHLDVTDPDAVDAFVADVVERYGRLDVLVNAAGRLDEADTVRFSELDTAAASPLLEVDVIGTMRMCHAVRPMMLESGGGAIVNFSSTYGNGTNPENAINFVPVTYSTARERSAALLPPWLGTWPRRSASTPLRLARSRGNGRPSGESRPTTSRRQSR
jgi:NAD(P)-dependent dehydrogenase (short-subunit alcohol dehydrogenase family)